ncbi:conserved hypothetical protein [Theileria equi strain WA]|uniref:BOP1 N-terminal domain-containing protein n=1 Tax=Theileria equi strain WA TaxID=1537102 RepID=L1LDA3_THEEQ|nr:conserved hypothetical protein [Theileria equi strain WA]EKX73422.1 conserved hypothetical protein [Theileria equi strain WA]|eukprot:XP_004832874.1 conserved hypothetical protein [Theileria equi strain WA]
MQQKKTRRSKSRSDPQGLDDASASEASTRSSSRSSSRKGQRAENSAPISAPESDSDAFFDSDEGEGDLNRSGNVPLKWYEQEDHIGYTVEGKKLIRELDSTEIGKMIFNSENPDAWRTVVDPRNNKMIRLTDEDLQIIRRIRKGMYPSESYNQEDLYVEFDNEDSIHPVSYQAAPKSRFLPSKWEAKKVARLVKLIRSGKIVIKKDEAEEEDEPIEDIWGDAIYNVNPQTAKRDENHDIEPPKIALPTHSESYNPPEEYLLTEEEKKEWLETAPEDRKVDYIPQKHDCLRRVGVYENLIVERFRRCLQLYLCPRAIKLKMNVDPESLYPKLPNVNELRPFPTKQSVEYRLGDSAYKLAVDCTGRWISAVVNSKIYICDILSGRPFHCIKAFKDIQTILWHPKLPVLIVANGSKVTCLAIELANMKRDETLDPKRQNLGDTPKSLYEQALELLTFKDGANHWEACEKDGFTGLCISHSGTVEHISVHQGGNYIVATCPECVEGINQCIIHCIPKKESMRVGNKIASNKIRLAIFHPTEPKILIAFTKSIRMYDLKSAQKTSTKDGSKLGDGKKFSGIELPISMDMNFNSSFLVASDEDAKVSLFDTEIGTFAYKTFR